MTREGDPLLSAIADRLAIDEVLNRYAHALDTHQFDLLDDVFTPDADLDYRQASPDGIRGDRATQVAWLRQSLEQFPVRQHFITNRAIRLDGDTAESRSYFYNPLGSRDADGRLRMLHVAGFYNDRFARTPGGWRIVVRVTEQAWFDR